MYSSSTGPKDAGVPGRGGVAKGVEAADEETDDELPFMWRRDEGRGGKMFLRNQNLSDRTESRLCAVAMFSSTYEMVSKCSDTVMCYPRPSLAYL